MMIDGYQSGGLTHFLLHVLWSHSPNWVIYELIKSQNGVKIIPENDNKLINYIFWQATKNQLILLRACVPITQHDFHFTLSNQLDLIK